MNPDDCINCFLRPDRRLEVDHHVLPRPRTANQQIAVRGGVQGVRVVGDAPANQRDFTAMADARAA